MITKRNIEILKIIVEEYIETWDVIWSKLLLKKYDLWVSSATVRNDMAKLEELELVYQPYHSAWRLPTTKGIRVFVDFLMQKNANYFLEVEEVKNNQKVENFYDLANKITFDLANKTWEISFFIMPENNFLEFSWSGNFLENNYKRLWESIFSIVKMLEEKQNFIKFINSHSLKNGINIFIWEENILNFLKDYTIIIKNREIWWKKVFIWIIWSLKMNYNFNITALNWII